MQDINEAKRQSDLSHGIGCQNTTLVHVGALPGYALGNHVSPDHSVCYRLKAMESYSLPMPLDYSELIDGFTQPKTVSRVTQSLH